MPELPEVETMVRGIRPFVEGREIVALRKCRCSCKPISVSPSLPRISRRVKGEAVIQVRRLAKRVVLELSSGDAVVIEPRMTGLMVLADPPNREHLRLEWKFAGNQKFNSLWFWDRRGLGTVRLYSLAELRAELGQDKLGPDALEMTTGQWKERCGKTGRAIKVALMDQKLVSGIGNLYASEILHAARIDPNRPADSLKIGEIRRLSKSVHDVLTDAIRNEGSTLSDATYRNALNRNGRYQNKHRVYKREGKPCSSCGQTPIQRIVQAQRSTFYCPVCQK